MCCVCVVYTYSAVDMHPGIRQTNMVEFCTDTSFWFVFVFWRIDEA